MTTKVPSERTSMGVLTSRCRVVLWKMATVAGLPLSKLRPEMVNGPPILTVDADSVMEGRVATGVAVGVGDGRAMGAVTTIVVWAWHAPPQQMLTV